MEKKQHAFLSTTIAKKKHELRSVWTPPPLPAAHGPWQSRASHRACRCAWRPPPPAAPSVPRRLPPAPWQSRAWPPCAATCRVPPLAPGKSHLPPRLPILLFHLLIVIGDVFKSSALDLGQTHSLCNEQITGSSSSWRPAMSAHCIFLSPAPSSRFVLRTVSLVHVSHLWDQWIIKVWVH